jgi:hypothetical protein
VEKPVATLPPVDAQADRSARPAQPIDSRNADRQEGGEDNDAAGFCGPTRSSLCTVTTEAPSRYDEQNK